MPRKPVTTKLDEELYEEMQILAVMLKCNTNDLLEEGMRMVRIKYAGTNDIIPKLVNSEKGDTT